MATEFNLFATENPSEPGLFSRLVVLIFRAHDIVNQRSQIEAFLNEKRSIPSLKVILVVIGQVPSGLEGWTDLSPAALGEYDLPVELLVYQAEAGIPDAGLPTALLLGLAELNVSEVKLFRLDGELEDYRRAPIGQRSMLFLFPGAIYPVSMGSHRRAISMIAALVDHDFDLTILFTGGNHAARKRAGAVLSLFAVELSHYSNGQDKWRRAVLEARRFVRSAIGRLRGRSKSVIEGFSDRAFVRNSGALRRQLDKLSLERFDSVFVNYAWMLPAVLERRTKLRNLICDTHDVQFFRAQSLTGQVADRAFERAKRDELNLLMKCDHVLAISERDASLLKRELPNTAVVSAPSSYRYCFLPVKRRLEHMPMTFGFLGHNMPANQIALEHVLRHWWPKVSSYSPASRFVIAGSICENKVVKQAAFLNDTIELAGFVKTLNSFFSRVDVLLSPVFVGGGMNFKNAEAIVAGLSLITNKLGAETLGDFDELHQVETPEQLLDTLREIELDATAEFERRSRAQYRLMHTFAPDAAIESIKDWIDGRGRLAK